MEAGRLIRERRATLVAALAVAAVVLAAAALGRRGAGAGRLVARVHAGDGSVRELPLDGADGTTLSVETALGTNVLVLEGGAVRMAEADCAHGDCLRQGAISRPGEQLVCLPHRLWVEVVAEGGEDGELDVSAVRQDGVDLVAE